MKIIYKPVDMIAWFEKNGQIHPIKFKFSESNINQVISVDRIQSIHSEKTPGKAIHVFECQSTMDGILKQYQLKYEINTCTWYLYKI